jgi:hypothetical protein
MKQVKLSKDEGKTKKTIQDTTRYRQRPEQTKDKENDTITHKTTHDKIRQTRQGKTKQGTTGQEKTKQNNSTQDKHNTK